jgi:DNA-binding MarR family transcriptional regulator
VIELACACANARRASRLVTQLYSQELGDGIEPGQFALLTAIAQFPGCTQAPLGRALGFDKTTLSRNLKLMARNGWVEAAAGLHLTAAGQTLLTEAKPAWQRAQQKLEAELPAGEWDRMMKSFEMVASAAARAAAGPAAAD